jgi:hypothetical protein
MKIFISPETLTKNLTPGNGGIYRATITNQKVATSGAGNPTLRLEFTLQSQGPNPESKTIGKSVWDSYAFTEDALWKINATYKAITGTDIPQAEYTPDELFLLLWNVTRGQTVLVTIEDELYNKEMRPRIKSIATITS